MGPSSLARGVNPEKQVEPRTPRPGWGRRRPHPGRVDCRCVLSWAYAGLRPMALTLETEGFSGYFALLGNPKRKRGIVPVELAIPR